MFFKSPKWNQTMESFPARFTYFDVFCILENIELALRHPANDGPSSDRVREIGRQMAEKLAEDIEDFTPEISEKTNWKKTFGLKI